MSPRGYIIDEEREAIFIGAAVDGDIISDGGPMIDAYFYRVKKANPQRRSFIEE